MTYRLLSPDEWNLVLPDFEQRGVPPPIPEFTQIVGAFNKGKLRGYLVCQLQFHFEPLNASDPFVIRGLVHAAERALLNQLQSDFTYYAHAPIKNIQRICELVGMKACPPVFQKMVNHPK